MVGPRLRPGGGALTVSRPERRPASAYLPYLVVVLNIIGNKGRLRGGGKFLECCAPKVISERGGINRRFRLLACLRGGTRRALLLVSDDAGVRERTDGELHYRVKLNAAESGGGRAIAVC